jgi:hypothetical protein
MGTLAKVKKAISEIQSQNKNLPNAGAKRILTSLVENNGKWEVISQRTFQGQPRTYGVGKDAREALLDAIQHTKDWVDDYGSPQGLWVMFIPGKLQLIAVTGVN